MVTSKNIECVVYYLPYEERHISNWKMVKCGGMNIPFKMGLGFLMREQSIEKIQHDLHEKCAPFPHIYLWGIGIRPDLQGKGIAGQIIRSLLKRMKELNQICYLETAKDKNVTLYEHFGFKLIDKATISLKELKVTMYGMLWYPSDERSLK
jgi:ribosomal protein S18 acetylase RimI-like enzyme